MQARPLVFTKKGCIVGEDVLAKHIHSSLKRGLPTIGQYYPHDMVAIVVGCGPSVKGQLESIRRQKERGRPIIALVEAHDWLIKNGIMPHNAVAVDPQEKIFFHDVRDDVQYWIASQCHPVVFDNLIGKNVLIWHLNLGKPNIYPPEIKMIGGGTSTGLCTMVLLYTMGFRRIELYGFDSCLSKDGLLRMNGDLPKQDKGIISVGVGDRWFQCNPAMAAQADDFQILLAKMPDLAIQSHGDGLITAILEERQRMAKLLEKKPLVEGVVLV